MTLMQTEAIKVCVRVRPLSPKELENNERVCVRIPPESPHPTTVMMLNPVDLSHSKNYSFDRAYWSVKPSDTHFATQDSIMEDLGAELVAHVMDGYNACLFAYGQTGSGKTYTILGHETPSEQAGLLPRITEDIFTRIQDDRNSTNEFVVTISYLEIYNEQIRDLLVSPEEPRYKLEVRAHPKFGNFVFGVKEVPVMDWPNTKAWLDFGVKSRAVASTSMNATSSRSHCIFSMEIVHKIWSGGNRTQLRSKVNVVDLAGSERQKKSQTSGTRLKEGAMVNQSLSNLSLVISRLAFLAKNINKENKKALDFIPFRSSKLTFLLEDSLRGNSKTAMIAALSPAGSDHDETTSTLQFAQHVKAVKTNAKKNLNQEDHVMQELEAECARLRQMVETGAGQSQIQELAALEEMQRKYGRNFQEQLKLANELQKQREMLLADAGLTSLEMSKSVGLEDHTPHLLNVCYDPELNGCLIYFLRRGVPCTMGSDRSNTISLKGLGMLPHMLEIHNVDNCQVVLHYKSGRVLLNGRLVGDESKDATFVAKAVLCHNDRIIAGHAFCFRLVIPSESNMADDVPLETALDEVEMKDDPNYQRVLLLFRNFQSRIGEIRAQQFRIIFKKVCRFVDEANQMAATMCPLERLRFSAEVLTDIFGQEDDTLEPVVRLRRLERGAARWRSIVRERVIKRPVSLLHHFVNISMQNVQLWSDQTSLVMKVEEFHQRLQCFRDAYKAVVTDGHPMDDLQPAERDCWSRIPPWVAAELEQEQLEREIALKEHLSKGRSGREQILEEQLSSMQRLLDAKDRRIESLEMAAAAKGLTASIPPRERRPSVSSPPSLDKLREVPANRKDAHSQVMSRAKDLIHSGRERRAAEMDVVERHLQDFDRKGEEFLEKLRFLRSEVNSEIDSFENAEVSCTQAEGLLDYRRLHRELDERHMQLEHHMQLQQELKDTLARERKTNVELRRAYGELPETSLDQELSTSRTSREALEREYHEQQQQFGSVVGLGCRLV